MEAFPGLAATYDLARAGFDCTLIEARSRLGGVIQTARVENCVVEDGPDSFLAEKPWALELIRELGLEDQVIGSNGPSPQDLRAAGREIGSASRRYSVHGPDQNRPHADDAAARLGHEGQDGAGVVSAARQGP